MQHLSTSLERKLLGGGGKKTVEKHKIQFEVWIREVTGLPLQLTGNVYIDWRRGSQNFSGTTKRVLVNNKKEASWEEKIIFAITLAFHQGNYQTRLLSLKLKEERNKTTVGKCDIDLAKYVNSNGNQIHVVHFLKSKMQLKFRVKTTLQRVNNQRIVGVAGKDQDGSHSLSLGNVVYQTVTDQNLSDNTFDDSPGTDSVDTVVEEMTDKKNGQSKKQHTTHIDGSSVPDLSDKIKELEALLDQKNLAIKGYEDEMELLQTKIDTLQGHNKQMKKKFDLQQTQLKALEQDGTATNIEQVSVEFAQLEELKERNAALEVTNHDLSEKIEGLEKQITVLKKKTDQQKKKLHEAKAKEADAQKQAVALDELNLDDPAEVMRLKVKLAMIQQNKDKEGGRNEGGRNGGGDGSTTARKQPKHEKSERNLKKNKSMGENPALPSDAEAEAKIRQLEAEVTLQKYIKQVIYHADQLMEEGDHDERVTSVALSLCDWLGSSSEQKDQSKFYLSLVDALRGSATRKLLNTSFEINVYWLATVALIRHYAAKRIPTATTSVSSGSPHDTGTVEYNGSSFLRDLELLISTIHAQLVSFVAQVMSNQVLNVLLSPERGNSRHHPGVPHHQTPSKQPNQAKITSGQLANSIPTVGTAMAILASASSTQFIWTMSDVVRLFDEMLAVFKCYSLPVPLIRSLFESFVFTINRLLFNMLLSESDYCTAGNGIQIKLNLSQLHEWLSVKSNKPFVGRAAQMLTEVTEAATVLSLDKSVLVEDNGSAMGVICPSLTLAQIKQLVVSFQPDKLSPDPVPDRVLKALNALIDRRANDERQGEVRIQDQVATPATLRLADWIDMKTPKEFLPE